MKIHYAHLNHPIWRLCGLGGLPWPCKAFHQEQRGVNHDCNHSICRALALGGRRQYVARRSAGGLLDPGRITHLPFDFLAAGYGSDLCEVEIFIKIGITQLKAT